MGEGREFRLNCSSKVRAKPDKKKRIRDERGGERTFEQI